MIPRLEYDNKLNPSLRFRIVNNRVRGEIHAPCCIIKYPGRLFYGPVCRHRLVVQIKNAINACSAYLSVIY